MPHTSLSAARNRVIGKAICPAGPVIRIFSSDSMPSTYPAGRIASGPGGGVRRVGDEVLLGSLTHRDAPQRTPHGVGVLAPPVLEHEVVPDHEIPRPPVMFIDKVVGVRVGEQFIEQS